MKVVQLYSITDTATTWKNSYFILSKRLDFYVVINLSIVVHALPVHTLISLSVDEILLPTGLLILEACCLMRCLNLRLTLMNSILS